jgi:hypothetical protein
MWRETGFSTVVVSVYENYEMCTIVVWPFRKCWRQSPWVLKHHDQKAGQDPSVLQIIHIYTPHVSRILLPFNHLNGKAKKYRNYNLKIVEEWDKKVKQFHNTRMEAQGGEEL